MAPKGKVMRTKDILKNRKINRNSEVPLDWKGKRSSRHMRWTYMLTINATGRISRWSD
jgi:hypothetical protein